MAKRRKMKKGPKILLFLIVVLIVLGSGYYIYTIFNKNEDNPIKDTITSIINDKTEDKKKEVTLSLIGDLMFEGPYLDSVNAGDNPDTYLSLVADKYFKKDDITVGNLETTITDNNKLKVNGYGYEFCTPQNIINSLDKNSIDVLGTTNNHTTDRGIDGINNTIDYLKNNTNITSVGTYKSKEDRATIRIVEKNGIKVGFVAYALGMNDFGKYINENEMWRLGLYRKPPSYNQVSDELVNTMREEIREVKKNADVVIAIMHWGKEFQFQEREVDQIKLAKVLNEEHVDIVVGAHSHCMQPVKWYTSDDNYKTLVFYSMGNFTSADNTLDGRAGPDYVKAYQVALLANINLELNEDNTIKYNSVKTEPIINYFDNNKRNFKMIPLSEYTNEYETSHILYNQGFNKTYINNLYTKQIDEQFR
ncbi:MAG: CapA family protein [Bacilli bacterium]|nr:CapA family protein [Bacilli bacterium]